MVTQYPCDPVYVFLLNGIRGPARHRVVGTGGGHTSFDCTLQQGGNARGYRTLDAFVGPAVQAETFVN